MKSGEVSIREIHWLMDMLQSIDLGLIVLDSDYHVQMWNSFMENHSGIKPSNVIGKSLFEMFPDIPADWLKNKIRSVHLLESRSFVTWEQRPYLFKFKSYHPITGRADNMYQNLTLMPLLSANGQVDRIGLIIYDVTDIAVNKLELKNANQELENLSRTDRLTQLNNRGYWEECLIQEFSRCRRTKQASTLIMFDIDHFKKVNDTYGHPAGDEVIRQTSSALRQAIRLTDTAGRYGGEEFGIILVDTNATNARLLAERLRQQIASLCVIWDSQEIRWTVSLGVAEFSDLLPDHKAWISCSDQALYVAKESGRNQSQVYTASSQAA